MNGLVSVTGDFEDAVSGSRSTIPFEVLAAAPSPKSRESAIRFWWRDGGKVEPDKARRNEKWKRGGSQLQPSS